MHPQRHHRATTLPPWAAEADRLDHVRHALLWRLALLSPYLLAAAGVAWAVAEYWVRPWSGPLGWRWGGLVGVGVALVLWLGHWPRLAVAVGCVGVFVASALRW